MSVADDGAKHKRIRMKYNEAMRRYVIIDASVATPRFLRGDSFYSRGFILFAGIQFLHGDYLPGSNCALDRVAGRSLSCKILLRDEMRCMQNSRTSPQKE